MQLNGKFVTKVMKKNLSTETDAQTTQISELPKISNN